MKQLLFLVVTVLLGLTTLAQQKLEVKDYQEGNTVFLIDYVKVTKADVDKLPGSKIATMNVVKGDLAKADPNARGKEVVIYFETKEYRKKKSAEKKPAKTQE
jgi:hypothetical protein